jgi:hypothetical protein
MPNATVMPGIRAWMEAHQEPATVDTIRRGAGVAAPSVRRFLRSLDPGDLEITRTPGRPLYRLRRTGNFEDDLFASGQTAQLSQAFAGLHRIAEAAGIFGETLAARSIGEVADILAAWCAERRHAPPARGGLAEAVEKSNRRWDSSPTIDYPAAQRITAGQVLEEYPPGQARPWRGSAAVLGTAMADAAAGEPVPVRGPLGPGEWITDRIVTAPRASGRWQQ